MKDNYGRTIEYLRISVTDLCNFRCVYCMPADGIEKQPHSRIMSIDDIIEVASEAASLGIKKIRLTGGEPLVRRGIVTLCRGIAAIPGIEDIAMTTNAVLLPKMARELKDAGLRRVNISLDTLDADKFRKITRCGTLQDTLDGINAAVDAGLEPLKINTVLIGGFNDDEIPALAELSKKHPVQVRFIELMPIGDPIFGKDAYIPCSAVTDALPELEPVKTDGVAKVFRFPGAPGTVGLISPVSSHFCATCNRLRLTADGHLKPCLHSREEISLMGLHGEELRGVLEEAILHKPSQHAALSATEHSESARNMNRIGG